MAATRAYGAGWMQLQSTRLRGLAPGVIACAVVAGAASFLSEHYGAPVMLFALLLGLAMNFLSRNEACGPGIDFMSRTVLRAGVALLGARITVANLISLGWEPLAIVLAAVVLTIAISMLAAKLLGFNPLFGLLSGGATAICGASAALALSAALPAHPLKERATVFTIIGVSVLSTAAMVLYPMIASFMPLDARAAGIFLGGSIHDVAQVVGAGYSMSPEAGDTATIVKLARVALLLPVILVAALVTRFQGAPPSEGKRPPLLPWFAVGFLIVMGLNSVGLLITPVQEAAIDLSRWCLIAAIAGLGMKTQLREFADVGLKPILFMIAETAFLAGLVLLMLNFLPA
jgi:uncharacterized integral membrane protein (TIGR00698 family)